MKLYAQRNTRFRTVFPLLAFHIFAFIYLPRYIFAQLFVVSVACMYTGIESCSFGKYVRQLIARMSVCTAYIVRVHVRTSKSKVPNNFILSLGTYFVNAVVVENSLSKGKK